MWSYETGRSVGTSPAVVGETVYVGSMDSTLYALDRVEGTEQWSLGSIDLMFSSPVVANGAVYIGSVNGHMYALDADSASDSGSLAIVDRDISQIIGSGIIGAIGGAGGYGAYRRLSTDEVSDQSTIGENKTK
ncbi:MAG: PQQ-binding-like beta-propeller repeat protein [Halapricum sp.]